MAVILEIHHRLILLVLTGVWGLAGFIAGTLFLGAFLLSNPTLVGKGYLHPLIPFEGKQLLKRFFRVTLPASERNQTKG